MALLELDGIVARYGAAEALHGISLSVAEAEIVTLLGPNGAGKSTILRAISGTHVTVATGQMRLGGIDILPIPAEARVAEGICHCPEGRHLFPDLSVRRNLELGAYLGGWTTAAAERLDLVFDLFPVLKDRLAQRCGTLSGGEQQMVAIGRALMGHPRLLLLDEPSVGIAHKLKTQIFTAIDRIRRMGTAVLIAEQDAGLALAIADRAILIEGGQVHAENVTDKPDLLADLTGL
jgi:branched-chain amino acid transport system ATP-binding protein